MRIFQRLRGYCIMTDGERTSLDNAWQQIRGLQTMLSETNRINADVKARCLILENKLKNQDLEIAHLTLRISELEKE